MPYKHPSPEHGARDSRTHFRDRDCFYQDVPSLIEDADSHGTSVVLLDIDIQGIDFVLRTFGPKVRDEMMRDVGKRVRDATGTMTEPYHITQDRLAVVLTDTTYQQANKTAQALVDSLTKPFNVNGVAYHLDANVGISHYPNHADSIVELVRTAVFACHQARESRKPYATFDSKVDEWERHRFRLMVDLKRALKDNSGVRFAYQPQVDLITGHCIGVEGLCRWEHTELGPISPGHFLPFVEQTALMLPLTEALLDEGLNDLTDWNTKGFDGTLAVNLSPALFRQPDLLDRIMEHFHFFNINPKQVHFEVTETTIMDQPNKAIYTLGAIRDWGCRIAIDDFGTGHSSLAYLADLPVDMIKIDRYFVKNLSQQWGEAIMGAAATLADKLNLQTIAEGIEDESQYRRCRELGIAYGQGFHIGHPMFKDDFQAWLTKH